MRETCDAACLRGLTKLSILIRVFVEMHEFSGSFSALILCIKKENHKVEEENTLGKYMDIYLFEFYYFLHNFLKGDNIFKFPKSGTLYFALFSFLHKCTHQHVCTHTESYLIMSDRFYMGKPRPRTCQSIKIHDTIKIIDGVKGIKYVLTERNLIMGGKYTV